MLRSIAKKTLGPPFSVLFRAAPQDTDSQNYAPNSQPPPLPLPPPPYAFTDPTKTEHTTKSRIPALFPHTIMAENSRNQINPHNPQERPDRPDRLEALERLERGASHHEEGYWLDLGGASINCGGCNQFLLCGELLLLLVAAVLIVYFVKWGSLPVA